MDARRRFTVDDLWRPEQPLPAKTILTAIAQRCAEAWNMPNLAGAVRVAYSRRMRTSLGRARLDEARVDLNLRLLQEHPEELVSTLVHELAHVAVHMRYGRVAPHGRAFRTLMRSLNLSAKATHDLNVKHLERRRRRFLYLHICSDCGYSFISHSIRRSWHCRACGPNMTWDVFRAAASVAGKQSLERLQAEKAGQAR